MKKKLLIVVDYQNDFVSGSLGCPQAVAIEDALAAKIAAYRALGEGGQVIFTMDTHDKNYLETQEGKNLPVPHCIKGTDGWELDSSLKEFQGKRFEKNTFGSTALMEYVQERPYESVMLIGVCTDICVISNAILAKAAQPEAQIIVDAQCVASNDPAMQEKAFDILENLHIDVANR